MNPIRSCLQKEAKLVRYGLAPISNAAVLEQQAILRRKEEVNYGPFIRNKATMPTNIVYKPLTSAHFTQALDLFLGPYLDLAPLSRAVRLGPADAEVLFGDRMDHSLANAASVVAVDAETDKVVGVILTETILKGRRLYTDRYSEPVNCINRFLEHVEGDAFVQLPDSKSILKLHDAVVKQNYQNLGIGKRLVELSIGNAQAEGCDYVTATATSPLVKMILEDKEDFTSIRSCSTKQYVDREEQEHSFQCIAHSSPHVTFMAKNLKPRLASEAPF